MKLHHEGKTLCVSEVPELSLAGATDIATKLHAALITGEANVVIDLSETTFMDCGGLGALLSLRNDRCPQTEGNVHLNFRNPTPPVRRLLGLTRMEHLVEQESCAQAA